MGLGFRIGSFLIPYYGSCIAIGIIVAALVGILQVRLHRHNIWDFVIIAGVGSLFGMLGAKLLYILVSLDSIDFSRLTDADYLSALMRGGFVFYGGVIGAIPGVLLGGKLAGVKPLPVINSCVPCIPIAHCFGRIGCSLVGCCYGCETEGAFAIKYTDSYFAPNNVRLFPVQPVEAAAELIIAIILIIYLDTKRNKPKNGLGLYLLLYAPVRFILEYFRADAGRGSFLFFSTSQWISIGMVLVAVYLNSIKRELNQNLIS